MQFRIITLSILLCAGVVYGDTTRKISRPVGRIVGGQNADPHSAPYIVSLEYRMRHFCGGSILSSTWVITAAHCMAKDKNDIKVIAGLFRLSNRLNSQTRRIQFVYIHEKYKDNIGPNDIALLRLSTQFKFNSIVSSIKLPSDGKLHQGDVTLFGWGKVSSNSLLGNPITLKTVTKPIVKYKECETALGGPGASPLDETNLCTGPLTGGTSACNGDSGGPLVQTTKSSDRELVGIVSWGMIPCGAVNSPSVYTKVSAFIKWINFTRNKKDTTDDS